MNAFRIGAVLMLMSAFAAAADAAVTVEDDSGRSVTLAQPARRIVSLAPHVTEMVYAAGAGQYLVGAVEYSNYPPQAKALPRVGGFGGLDLEAIAALKPDLIIAWPSGNPAAQVEQLQRLGFPVYRSEPRRIDDVGADIERIGALAGTGVAARRAGNAFRARLARLRARHAGRSPVRVFYEVWNQPLITVNSAHIISDVIRLCGGRNVFADLPALAPHVDVEAVIAADPQVIVASGLGAERPAWLDAWRRWPQIDAVRHNRLYVIHPDIIQRPSPRILEGVERMCRLLDEARTR